MVLVGVAMRTGVHDRAVVGDDHRAGEHVQLGMAFDQGLDLPRRHDAIGGMREDREYQQCGGCKDEQFHGASMRDGVVPEEIRNRVRPLHERRVPGTNGPRVRTGCIPPAMPSVRSTHPP